MCCAKVVPGRSRRAGGAVTASHRKLSYGLSDPRSARGARRQSTVALGGEKQRAVLAILLLHRNEVVSADRLIDELWGESPPAGARRTLRAYVSKLRRAMGANGASSAVGRGF